MSARLEEVVRVAKRAKTGGFTVHGVSTYTPGRTLCGRLITDLDVVEQVKATKLAPANEACFGCARVLEDWATGNKNRERYEPPGATHISRGRRRTESTAPNTKRGWRNLR